MNITSKRETLKKFYSPFGWALSKANVHPNVITLFSLIFGLVSAYLYYQRHPLLAAFTLAASGILDLCDGYVAVNNKKATKFGAVFDWISDKAVDGAVLGAAALAFSKPWFAVFLVTVSMLHTFIKPVAYAEIGYAERKIGKIKDPLENTGFFGRPETLITLFLASLLYPVYKRSLALGLFFIGLMTFFSLMHRLYYLYVNYGSDYDV